MVNVRSQSHGRTEIGKVREENQDQFFIADLSRSMSVHSNSLGLDENSQVRGGELGYLFLVADGMGGHRGGREASQLAIHYFISSILNSMRWIVKIDAGSEERFLMDLQGMLTNAHRTMKLHSEQESDLQGMGSTLTMSYVSWPRMIVVHAGDTRCYVLRNGELRLITRDHTVANQLIQSGRLPPDAEARSPWANVLVNALGAGAENVFADIYQLELEFGDRILLCSDGLNKHLEDRSIEKILKEFKAPEQATEVLVQAALEDGGSDNITVVVADFLEESQPATMMIRYSNRGKEGLLYEAQVPSDEVDTSPEDRSFQRPYPGEHPTRDYGETPTADF